jgi:hypothetical protein
LGTSGSEARLVCRAINLPWALLGITSKGFCLGALARRPCRGYVVYAAVAPTPGLSDAWWQAIWRLMAQMPTSHPDAAQLTFIAFDLLH